jgi:MATE family multidrug resistance protein
MSSRSSIQNILKLSIPIFFANLVIPIVAIVDTGLMGNLDNASYLVATSIAASVFSILFGSFGFLRSGTVGMVAQADGSSDYQEIVNIFLRNIAFVIINFPYQFLNYHLKQKNISKIILYYVFIHLLAS